MEFVINLIQIIIGFLGGGYLTLKIIAPRTKTKKDDHLLDTIDGICNEFNIDPDIMAKKSLGRLKKKL